MSGKKEENEILNNSDRKRGPFSKQTQIFADRQAQELEKYQRAKENKSEEKAKIKLRDRGTLQKNSLVEFSNLISSPKRKSKPASKAQKPKL